tara:strand:- start:221 stop:370 length:150 start_codon:yes stop_codon:yes gene_type:complete
MKNLLDWKTVIGVLVALLIWFYVSPMLTTGTTTENGNTGSDDNGGTTGA